MGRCSQTRMQLFYLTCHKSYRSTLRMKDFALVLAFLSQLGWLTVSSAQCIADEDLNTAFAQIINGDNVSTTYDISGSCCQEQICGLGCPEEVDQPSSGKKHAQSFIKIFSLERYPNA